MVISLNEFSTRSFLKRFQGLSQSQIQELSQNNNEIQDSNLKLEMEMEIDLEQKFTKKETVVKKERRPSIKDEMRELLDRKVFPNESSYVQSPRKECIFKDDSSEISEVSDFNDGLELPATTYRPVNWNFSEGILENGRCKLTNKHEISSLQDFQSFWGMISSISKFSPGSVLSFYKGQDFETKDVQGCLVNFFFYFYFSLSFFFFFFFFLFQFISIIEFFQKKKN